MANSIDVSSEARNKILSGRENLLAVVTRADNSLAAMEEIVKQVNAPAVTKAFQVAQEALESYKTMVKDYAGDEGDTMDEGKINMMVIFEDAKKLAAATGVD